MFTFYKDLQRALTERTNSPCSDTFRQSSSIFAHKNVKIDPNETPTPKATGCPSEKVNTTSKPS